MTQATLKEIIKNAQTIKSNPADPTGRTQNMLIQNLLEIAASNYSTAEKKAITVDACQLGSCPAILPELIKQAPDAKTKEIFAEVAADYARDKKSSVHIIPLVKDTGLGIDSPARQEIVQAAIDYLPLAKSNQHHVANMVLGICKTPQEVRTAAQKIGGIVQSMNSDDAYLQLMETSFKAAAEAAAKLPDNRRPLNTAHLLKAEIG
ncbi:MAG TPA: hypothetical protein VFS88_09855 [Micavibrio sp.]|nr:hypothetical protein [Micavibrio sp.]